MSKIIEYKVIEFETIKTGDLEKFNKLINDEIATGWVPFGGISTFLYSNAIKHGEFGAGTVYSQAMVKYQ